MLIDFINRIQLFRRRIFSHALRRFGGFGSCGRANFDPNVRIDNPRWMHLADGVLLLRGGWLYCIPPEPGAEPPRLTIGEGTYIGCYSHIVCGNRLTMGPGCLLANYVYIADASHRYRDPDTPPLRQGMKLHEVEIGRNVWIGEHACIFGNVKIGDHSVIGANAVVTNCEIPPYSIVAGSPATVIRQYTPEPRTSRT